VPADVRVNADGTPDFIRWSRPQTDGPAMRCLALLRWRAQFKDLEADASRRALLGELIGSDLAFTRARVRLPSSGVWEEDSGYHYYTQLLQAEALRRGAEWLEELGESDEARVSRVAAEETHARLDGYWCESAGFYRACVTAEPGDRRALDSAVVLAVLHGGRAHGAHSVLDPRAQATLGALEELFEARYAINRERPPDRGAALGRYADDRYYGGGAWFLTTLRRRSSTSDWRTHCERARACRAPRPTHAFGNASARPSSRARELRFWPWSAAMPSCARCRPSRPRAGIFPSSSIRAPARRPLRSISPGVMPPSSRRQRPEHRPANCGRARGRRRRR